MQIIAIPNDYIPTVYDYKTEDVQSSSLISFINRILFIYRLKHAPNKMNYGRVWIHRNLYMRLRKDLRKHNNCNLLGKIKFRCTDGMTYYIYPSQSMKVRGKFR